MKEVFLYHTINSTIFTLFNFIHIIKLSKIPFTYINLFCRSILTLQLFFTIHIGRPHQRYFDSVYKSFRIEIRIKKLENNLVEKTHVNSNANPYHLLLIEVNAHSECFKSFTMGSNVAKTKYEGKRKSMSSSKTKILQRSRRRCKTIISKTLHNL